jgi:hypothetical protein
MCRKNNVFHHNIKRNIVVWCLTMKQNDEILQSVWCKNIDMKSCTWRSWCRVVSLIGACWLAIKPEAGATVAAKPRIEQRSSIPFERRRWKAWHCRNLVWWGYPLYAVFVGATTESTEDDFSNRSSKPSPKGRIGGRCTSICIHLPDCSTPPTTSISSSGSSTVHMTSARAWRHPYLQE